jgi:hypothetical protein
MANTCFVHLNLTSIFNLKRICGLTTNNNSRALYAVIRRSNNSNNNNRAHCAVNRPCCHYHSLQFKLNK